LSEKTRGEAGVERAEALVLDDVRRDRDRAAGGAELKADLWFVRTSTCLGSTERTCTARFGLENRGSEEGERGDRARVARAIGALRGPRRDSARVVRNGRGRVSYRRRRHRMKGTARGRGRGRATPVVPASRAIGATFPSPGRRRCHRAHLDDIQGLDDAGGAHAGQAAVHERLDGFPGGVIFQRHDDAVVWCVRRRTARRSRGDAFSFATERLSPEPAAAGDFAISVVRHEFRVGIFCESVASRGESRVINPRRIEKRKPLLRAFFCRHRETGTRAISRNLFSKKDHSRRAVRVTIEAPGARDAFGGASRRTVGSCAFPVARTRARAHVARAREHTALSVVRATAKRGARVQP